MAELLDFILSHDETFKSKARLASLYSDFAVLKSSNPDGYDANIAAWRSALERAGRAGLTAGGNTLVLGTGEDLLRRLESDEAGRPLSLGCVVSEAVNDGGMIPLREFLGATQSVYKKSWVAVPTLSGVAKWVLSQIGVGSTSSGVLPKGDFVVLGNAEEMAQRILEQIAHAPQTPTSLLYSLDTFMDSFAHVREDAPGLSKTDASVILKYLARDKHAASVDEAADGSTTIKFASPSSQAPPTPVTQHDKTIASLRSLTRRLHVQCDALTGRIAELDKTARAEVSANRRDRALAALRRRKAFEATLGKREDSLAQVEGVLNSIDEAAGQVELVGAMEASSAVLRELNKQVGGVERVDAVMDTLRENMDDVDEINRVLVEPGAQGVDEDEIDDELEALERETKKSEEQKAAKEKEERERQMVEDAPSVPKEKADAETEAEQAMEKRLDELSLE